MLTFRICIVVLTLSLVHLSVSKPTEGDNLNEGRGIVSTVWGWITYPFYWWSSDETKQPVTEPLIGLPNNPSDIVSIGTHNVTVWCNDQICTTMKCNRSQCRNITCNLYDTNLNGECREYNILDEPVDKPVSEPEQHIQATSTEVTTNQHFTQTTDSITKRSNEKTDLNIQTSTISIPKEKDNIPSVEEHPLELEAVLSSSVNRENTEKVVNKEKLAVAVRETIPETKV